MIKKQYSFVELMKNVASQAQIVRKGDRNSDWK